MKPLLLLPLVLLVAAPAPPVVRVTFSPLSKAAYQRAQTGCLTAKPTRTFPLKKQGRRITIATARGQRVFADKYVGTDRADQQRFEYGGYLPAYKLHVVVAHYWERTQWLLLTDAGQQVALWGEPDFAPDGRYLLAICQGLEYAGGQPNSLELWAPQADGVLHRLWHLKPTTWEPAQACWLTATTLLLAEEHWTEANPGGYTYARLTVR